MNRSNEKSLVTHSRGIIAGRIAFLTTLCFVATLLGVLAEVILKKSEQTLAKQQFKSIASSAVISASFIVKRKLHGVNTMAKIAGNANPNAKDWPFVFVQGFEEIATALRAASDGRGIAFVPVVLADELAAFEDFAYTFYNSTRKPEPLPSGAGVRSFGKGIWGKSSEGDYWDNKVQRDYETDYEYFAPVLQEDVIDGTILMFNLRSEKIRGSALDSVVRCSLKGFSACDQMTDVINLITKNVTQPAALLISPVFPSVNRTAFPSGFVASSIVFFELFQNLFGEEVDGILCILENPSSPIEFLVRRGQDIKIVEGEFQSLSKKFKDIKAEAILTTSKLLGGESPVYKLTLYPTQRFFDSYSTRNPLLASVGSVFIIALTGLLFMIYDFYVRREFSHKSELLETKRKFMRFVCHEVRTPMNSVCLGLSLIQEEMESALKTGVESANIRSWTDISMEINQSAQRAVDVLSDLLNYDKVEQGNFKLELSVFSTRDVVEKTTSEFNLEAKRRGLNCTIIVNVSPIQDYVLVGDKLRLTQVLRNLLSNALKFTPAGGKLTITVTEDIEFEDNCSASEIKLYCGTMISVVPVGKAHVSVEDSGAGMTKDQIDGLFMDGVQFNANELQAGKGSGIGLYIAKGIVEQHNGTLSCTSPGLGCGSVFSLELPLYKSIHVECGCSSNKKCLTQSDDENPTVETHVTSKSSDTSPLNFLVVDDSSTNLKLLMRLLEREGHWCIGAGNGKEAIGLVKSGDYDFDVVLLDFEMPEMNGPTAASALRSMGCTLLIIGITGNMLVDDVRYFKDRGADEVLGKPVKVGQIEDVIARYGLQGNRSSI